MIGEVGTVRDAVVFGENDLILYKKAMLMEVFCFLKAEQDDGLQGVE